MTTQQRAPLDHSLHRNLTVIRKAIGTSGDIIIREFQAGRSGEVPAAIIYADGLADANAIQSMVLRPLMLADMPLGIGQIPLASRAKEHIVYIGDVEEITDLESLYKAFLTGNSVLLFEGDQTALSLDTKGWKERSVDEPSTQNVIRGPKEAFTETLKTNIGLLRRRIKSTTMQVEYKTVGRLTQTDLAIVYMDGIVADEVLNEVRHRLSLIDIDAIFESGNIEEFIQEEQLTYFPTVFNTERPDVVAAGLVEGRVAIIVDGTPFVLLVPALFIQFLQSPDDYYQRADIGSILRTLRLVALFIAMLAPAAFIAITSFHQEMLPSSLLISIAASRSGVPFPVFVEALIMEITFELLREAGLRMPKAIGQAISIVGALVLGEAAVQAGLVSPGMVIIVSLTAITTFVIPYSSLAVPIRLLRFSLMGLAAMFGLYGIFVGLTYVILHLNTLRSFGVPYLKPYAPFIMADQKDGVWFRAPIWKMLKRPLSLVNRNQTRQRPPVPKPSGKE
ncbi:spore germination protein KA [Paenibacillus phyllosphaerae]|uniref:Spore germination protein KA n=1 Tax=Paenibacillus phyllosphaerae TaxID=274593 RepID=A0A7W5AXU0_9BACL|nr:spore germination protein [Paenibacillus phyllosphaerae]MBB3110749.1 spore germination protein KA [Paenibacillus phyllosphaerae]